jgi:anti-anti-sigma regulatory factor
MLRISAVASPDQVLVLRLEGRLVGPWVLELDRACDRAFREGRRLTLDLTDVSFIDGDGLALVRGLEDRSTTLVNCSPFVAEQLRRGAR